MKYEEGQHGDPAWLAQHAVTRLLAEPHYHVPLPPPRNDAERAARAHDITAGLAEDCHLAARLVQRMREEGGMACGPTSHGKSSPTPPPSRRTTRPIANSFPL